MDYIKYIEENTIRCEAGFRGGGIEISLDNLLNFREENDYRMTAYQNYLGGGLLGKICNSYNFDLEDLSQARQIKVAKIAEELNRYYHNLTNHAHDEWESETYEHNQQTKPESAY